MVDPILTILTLTEAVLAGRLMDVFPTEPNSVSILSPVSDLYRLTLALKPTPGSVKNNSTEPESPVVILFKSTSTWKSPEKV